MRRRERLMKRRLDFKLRTSNAKPTQKRRQSMKKRRKGAKKRKKKSTRARIRRRSKTSR